MLLTWPQPADIRDGLESGGEAEAPRAREVRADHYIEEEARAVCVCDCVLYTIAICHELLRTRARVTALIKYEDEHEYADHGRGRKRLSCRRGLFLIAASA